MCSIITGLMRSKKLYYNSVNIIYITALKTSKNISI